MKLYELLIAGFFIPAFWFFWMWAARIAAIGIIGKLISLQVNGMKEKVSNMFKGRGGSGG